MDKINEHRVDILGNKIEPGKAVAFTWGKQLRIGIVTKINPIMIAIRNVEKPSTTPHQRRPEEIIVLNDPRVALYLLSVDPK